MFSLLVLTVLLSSAEYSAVEIPQLPEKESFGGEFVTEGGMVGGYWDTYFPPGHAGAVISAPFVWRDGKLIALPLEKNKFGHALGGSDSIVVGDVRIDDGTWAPAVWTPGETGGWQNAKLRFIFKEEGAAKFVANDGKVWGNSETGFWSWDQGLLTRYPVGRCQLIGVDKKGVVYLNKVRDGAFAGSTIKTAYLFQNGRLTKLDSKEGPITSLKAVNVDGVAIGETSDEPIQWKDGVITKLASNKARAKGINNLGEVVGHIIDGDSHRATLWKNGVAIDISKSVAGFTVFEAYAINGKGQIVALVGVGDRGKLHLLTPKQ